MDDLTIAINTIVKSYFDEISKLTSYIDTQITAAIIDMDAKRRERKQKSDIKKLKNIIDFYLAEFRDIHQTHVEEFWEYVNELVTSEGKQKIAEIKLKESFNHFQKEAYRATFKLQHKAADMLNDMEFFQISYRLDEIKKLHQITFDILYDSWLNKVNPLTGENVTL